MVELIKKNKFNVLLLGAIFLLAVVARVALLTSFPVGFQTDEAIIGDNANFILQTLHDTNNTYLPIQTEVFGDYNPTGTAYLTIIPIKIFGLNVFAVRSVGAVLGAITVITVFFLALVLFKNILISFVSAGLFALSPWHIMLSRSSEQTVAALFFIVLGFTLFIWSIRRASRLLLLLSGVIFFISYFMYFTPRLFVPGLILLLSILLYKKILINKGYVAILMVLFVSLSLFSLWLVMGQKGGAGRINQVSIFSAPEGRLILEEQIRESGTQNVPPVVVRMVHNKVENYAQTFIGNYLSYFSGEYLFVTGGLPMFLQTHQSGLLYIVELPFLIYGIYMLIRKKDKYAKVILVWLLFSPVIAALTIDDIPNIRRSLMMTPAFAIITAFGVCSIPLRRKYLRIIMVVVCVIYLWCVFHFFYQYFVHAKIHRPWYRNNGFSEMMKVVNQNYDKYDHIVMTKIGGGYPLVLFFSRYDPKTYLAEGAPKDQDYKGFGKFIFTPQDCPSINFNGNIQREKTLFVDAGTCKLPTVVEEKTTVILREDGTPAFKIVN